MYNGHGVGQERMQRWTVAAIFWTRKGKSNGSKVVQVYLVGNGHVPTCRAMEFCLLLLKRLYGGGEHV